MPVSATISLLQITDTVYPMYKAFIEPDLKAAQLKIHNSFNPFTGFMNATYILKAPRAKDLTQEAVVAVLGVSGWGHACSGCGDRAVAVSKQAPHLLEIQPPTMQHIAGVRPLCIQLHLRMPQLAHRLTACLYCVL
jgi:hypothetical protein